MRTTRLIVLLLFLLSVFSVSSSHAGLLGPAEGFNAFVFGDMIVNNSDSQGRIAIGGTVDVEFYGVGSEAAPDTYSLIGGGKVDYVSGTVSNGGIYSGGNVYLNHHTIYGDVTATGTVTIGPNGGTISGSTNASSSDPSPIDFSTAYTTLNATSDTLKNMIANGNTHVESWGAITLTGTKDVNIFHLDGSDLDDAVSLTFDVNPDSTSIVNVSGTTNTFNNFNIGGADGLYSNILYNFYDSTDLTIGGISIKGSILAADAAVAFNSANIDGTLVAGSITGGGQFHQHLFDPDVPVVPEPVSSTLFLVGGTLFGWKRLRKK